MFIIPAIDLKNGNCVRLLKGEEGTETVFSNSPSDTARKWERCRAEWIHVVDLDGAFKGNPRNFEAVEEIVRSVSSNVQVGGGIRNIATVERYLEIGIKRVIIGTSAFTDRDFLEDICRRFPGKIAVGVDTKGGKIALRGWKETIDMNIARTMLEFRDIGVSLVIHTNVDRDGTMEGIDTASIRNFLSMSPLPVIVSGGIASLADLSNIQSIADGNLFGAILGKSIYSGSIDLKDSIQRFQ
ncbi:MAG: 1-(5-phosphoribosyl)-5-[(5-phosphoribosylamino)methylideneamino]imidazole-4-carboxamide isomerase [Candidatus Dadabacteria bacterium]|nr:1-(5-phosphoribosyl)-5-[(5-phosphoribosylamino)methylideneamino]imidazole-4-carboxamide isomerase [Candidatus Dadabacteria bacterium]MDE0519450.1 1-(5-phosphoribosyl)-5-[(5-phosphoribosylamino)methylideneamino]imidazole-4-carboxamide isomerase [Candidatus Dadabacteria bacterium]MDE0662781.1 1-(5-phosphoribosyl)-5-[(5-phosphoribosylamino)methylideneamino]imidazole-4-carboxamide isomerase [Candidatus Dadabacteria bacterium]